MRLSNSLKSLLDDSGWIPNCDFGPKLYAARGQRDLLLSPKEQQCRSITWAQIGFECLRVRAPRRGNTYHFQTFCETSGRCAEIGGHISCVYLINNDMIHSRKLLSQLKKSRCKSSYQQSMVILFSKQLFYSIIKTIT